MSGFFVAQKLRLFILALCAFCCFSGVDAPPPLSLAQAYDIYKDDAGHVAKAHLTLILNDVYPGDHATEIRLKAHATYRLGTYNDHFQLPAEDMVSWDQLQLCSAFYQAEVLPLSQAFDSQKKEAFPQHYSQEDCVDYVEKILAQWTHNCGLNVEGLVSVLCYGSVRPMTDYPSLLQDIYITLHDTAQQAIPEAIKHAHNWQNMRRILLGEIPIPESLQAEAQKNFALLEQTSPKRVKYAAHRGTTTQ